MTDDFGARLLAWFDREGRHDLPWQRPRTPYRVWLAEVMLQQTQVATVIPYFERFVGRFPNFSALAAAPLDDVLALWAGLGYYARGRNLHAAARQIVAIHGGAMPQTLAQVQALPGIGRSTAAAILAQAFGERQAILDGNVKRVLARHAGIDGWPGEPAVAKQLWSVSENRLPAMRLADYTQAIMDLGATLCTARAPACARCPVATDCAAHLQNRVALLPSPRPRRERPLRHASLLLVENSEGALLFERRPSSGLWGGLWCLPIAQPGEELEHMLAERYGLVVQRLGELPGFRHGFTHFELELRPIRLRAAPLPNRVAEHEARRWLNMNAPLPGLPAPVLQFLTRTSNPCPELSLASSLAPRPKASTGRRSPARSASASSIRSRNRPGATGSHTRRG